MEDYTYHFGPGTPKVLGAHMLEVCPSITTSTRPHRDPPADIGARERSGPAALRGATRGRRSSSASPTSVTASGSCSTRSTSSSTGRAHASAARRARDVDAPTVDDHRRSSAGSRAAGRTTPCCRRASTPRPSTTSPRCCGPSSWSSTARPRRDASPTSSAGTRRTTGSLRASDRDLARARPPGCLAERRSRRRAPPAVARTGAARRRRGPAPAPVGRRRGPPSVRPRRSSSSARVECR